MTTATLCAAVLLAQSSLAIGHHKARGGCGDCGSDPAYVAQQIVLLQTCPKWRARDDAAHALGKVGWRCHPEVVPALVTALLTDCHKAVRGEAAEALKRLAPCSPEAELALERAAKYDPDHWTRKKASKALVVLAKSCRGPCDVCEPAPVIVPGSIRAVPTVIEYEVAPQAPVEAYPPDALPYTAPGRGYPFRQPVPLDPTLPRQGVSPMPYEYEVPPDVPLDRSPALPSPTLPFDELEPLPPPAGAPVPFDGEGSARRDEPKARPTPRTAPAPTRTVRTLFPMLTLKPRGR